MAELVDMLEQYGADVQVDLDPDDKVRCMRIRRGSNITAIVTSDEQRTVDVLGGGDAPNVWEHGRGDMDGQIGGDP